MKNVAIYYKIEAPFLCVHVYLEKYFFLIDQARIKSNIRTLATKVAE